MVVDRETRQYSALPDCGCTVVMMRRLWVVLYSKYGQHNTSLIYFDRPGIIESNKEVKSFIR